MDYNESGDNTKTIQEDLGILFNHISADSGIFRKYSGIFRTPYQTSTMYCLGKNVDS